MVFEELQEQFLYSRRNGLSGARGQAREKSLIYYDRNLRYFYSFMQEQRSRSKYQELTRADIRAYVEKVNNNPDWGAASRLTNLRAVRALLKFVEKDEECREEGLKPLSMYLPRIGKSPRRSVMPSPADLKRWRNAFDTSKLLGFRDYVIYSLIISTGMRIGEICWLRLEHLQLDNRLLYVPEEGKTGSRLVPLTKEMVALLKGWLKRREKCTTALVSPFVFVSRKDPQCTVNAIDQRFSKLREKYQLPKLSPHVVRHAFATYYLRNGGGLEQLRNILGHKGYEMVKEYLFLAEVGGDAAKEELERVSPLKMLNGVKL